MLPLLFLLAGATPPTSAPLPPCGAHASFEIVQDGGTNFEGEIRVARSQPGKKIELDFGANAVRVRAESVSGATLLMTASSGAAASGSAKPVFRLEKAKKAIESNFPPGVVRFRADGLPSQPTLRCDLADELAAFPPHPPPPPPACGASLMWRNGRMWNGGWEAFVEVGGRGIPPSSGRFAIVVDFGTAGGFEVLDIDKASVGGSEEHTMTILPDLGATGLGRITMRVRGNAPGSPRLRCVPAPPTPPPPPMPCALGASWTPSPDPSGLGSSGVPPRFSGTVTLQQWVSGSEVTLAFGSGHALISSPSNSVSLLPSAPDDASAGVGLVRLLGRQVGRPHKLPFAPFFSPLLPFCFPSAPFSSHASPLGRSARAAHSKSSTRAPPASRQSHSFHVLMSYRPVLHARPHILRGPPSRPSPTAPLASRTLSPRRTAKRMRSMWRCVRGRTAR